jgi:hypothetical protein
MSIYFVDGLDDRRRALLPSGGEQEEGSGDCCHQHQAADDPESFLHVTPPSLIIPTRGKLEL